MEQNNKFQENLETDLIADALSEELEAIGKQAVKENAQCDDIPFYQLKGGTNKRFARFISSRIRKEKYALIHQEAQRTFPECPCKYYINCSKSRSPAYYLEEK